MLRAPGARAPGALCVSAVVSQIPRLFLWLDALHPIRRQCTPSDRVYRPVTGAAARNGCSAPRTVVSAGLLCAPVGGGPPASRPRRELRSARRLEARPSPAAAHGHRSLAPRPSGSSGALRTGGRGGFALHDAFWRRVVGVSEARVVQFPRLATARPRLEAVWRPNRRPLW